MIYENLSKYHKNKIGHFYNCPERLGPLLLLTKLIDNYQSCQYPRKPKNQSFENLNRPSKIFNPRSLKRPKRKIQYQSTSLFFEIQILKSKEKARFQSVPKCPTLEKTLRRPFPMKQTKFDQPALHNLSPLLRGFLFELK